MLSNLVPYLVILLLPEAILTWGKPSLGDIVIWCKIDQSTNVTNNSVHKITKADKRWMPIYCGCTDTYPDCNLNVSVQNANMTYALAKLSTENRKNLLKNKAAVNADAAVSADAAVNANAAANIDSAVKTNAAANTSAVLSNSEAVDTIAAADTNVAVNPEAAANTNAAETNEAAKTEAAVNTNGAAVGLQFKTFLSMVEDSIVVTASIGKMRIDLTFSFTLLYRPDNLDEDARLYKSAPSQPYEVLTEGVTVTIGTHGEQGKDTMVDGSGIKRVEGPRSATKIPVVIETINTDVLAYVVVAGGLVFLAFIAATVLLTYRRRKQERAGAGSVPTSKPDIKYWHLVHD